VPWGVETVIPHGGLAPSTLRERRGYPKEKRICQGWDARQYCGQFEPWPGAASPVEGKKTFVISRAHPGIQGHRRSRGA